MKKYAIVLLDDYWHPADTILPLLPKILPDSEWNVRVTDDPNYIGAVSAAPDLLMNFKDGIANTQIPTPNWYAAGAWSPWTHKLLVEMGGAGFIGVHCGLANIPQDSPIYTELLRGRFLNHPPKCPVTVHIAAQHPVTEGVTDFTIDDEHYQMEGMWDKTNVLATTQSQHGEQVGVWTHECGNGRVVGITPGHTTEVLLSDGMLRLLRNAVNWAAKR